MPNGTIPGPCVTITNCTSCNIRTGPGDGYAIVDTCGPGDSFQAVDTSGWVPVRIDKQVRWISAKYAKEG